MYVARIFFICLYSGSLILVSGLHIRAVPEQYLDIDSEVNGPFKMIPLHSTGASGKYEKQLSRPTCDFDKPSWQAYVKFHREGRRNLTKGKEARVLIWRCAGSDFCGGNGDTIRGLLGALSTAIETNRVFLIGEWTRAGFDVLSLFENEQIDWHYDRTLKTMCKTTHTHHINGVDIDPREAIRSSSVPCLSTTTNMYHGLNGMLSAGCAWNAVFRRSAFYQDALSDRMAVFPESSRNNYAAVHFRAGDAYMPHAGGDTRVKSDAFEKVLAAALNCGQSHSAAPMLMLLTDSIRAQELVMNKSWAESFAPGIAPAVPIESSGEPVAPLHTEPARGATQHAVLNAWLDQGVIANAKMVVMTSGGFANTASDVLGAVPLRYKVGADLACVPAESFGSL